MMKKINTLLSLLLCVGVYTTFGMQNSDSRSTIPVDQESNSNHHEQEKLMTAICHDNINTAELLILKLTKTKNFDCALITAAHYNRILITQFILAFEQNSEAGITEALTIAIESRNATLVDILVNCGKTTSKTLDTAIALAARLECEGYVSSILAHPAITKYGIASALWEALHNHHYRVFKILSGYIKKHPHIINSNNVLLAVAQFGYDTYIRELLTHPGITDETRSQVLHYLIEYDENKFHDVLNTPSPCIEPTLLDE
jgi:hypothetical protein